MSVFFVRYRPCTVKLTERKIFMKKRSTKILACLLAVCLLLSGRQMILSPVSAHVAFSTTQIREILSAIAEGVPVDDSLSSVADYDGNGDVDSSDVRGLLCELTEFQGDVAVNPRVFRLSSIDDTVAENGKRTYSVIAPYTDSYTVTPDKNVRNVSFSKNGNLLAASSDARAFSVRLQEGEVYTLNVTGSGPNAAFRLDVAADNHPVTLPYDVIPGSSDVPSPYGSDPLVPAEVHYEKRQGGTYIYLNNPEAIPAESVGKAFYRTEDLTGEVYVTLENANYSGKEIYLGYQLKNDGDTDAYITVTNIGYQAGGTWFGQLACYDFYNTHFELPADYFSNPGKYFADFAYQDYRPRVYQPTTYRLPPGEYFYVIGGTSADAYRQINVGNTANRLLGQVKCANGNVKFYVTGGSVTGTYYCYTDASQVRADPPAVGYRTGAYAAQYIGEAPHSGVIDNFMTWTVNDNVAAGMLPVSYTNRYDANAKDQVSPYFAYNSTEHRTNRATGWMTHLNPQNDHLAVGMDMVEFHCADQNGRQVVIDNDHADGAGNRANTGNWMIEYQDHFTLVNQGNRQRTVFLRLRDHGTLAVLARDGKTGEVLEAKYTCGLGNVSGDTYVYTLTLPAHSVKQITLDYWLVACSYGSVTHSAVLE